GNRGRKITTGRRGARQNLCRLPWMGGGHCNDPSIGHRDMTHFKSRIAGRASGAVLLGAASALALTIASTGSALAGNTCELSAGGNGGATTSVDSTAFACGPSATADGDDTTAVGSGA